MSHSFTKVPDEWTADASMSPTAFRVLVGLRSFARDKDACFPRNKAIGERAGLNCDERTIRRVLKELQVLGYVRVEFEGRKRRIMLSRQCENVEHYPDKNVRLPGQKCPPYPDKNVRLHKEADAMKQMQRTNAAAVEFSPETERRIEATFGAQGQAKIRRMVANENFPVEWVRPALDACDAAKNVRNAFGLFHKIMKEYEALGGPPPPPVKQKPAAPKYFEPTDDDLPPCMKNGAKQS